MRRVKNRIEPAVAVAPTPGAHVNVICIDPPYECFNRRTGTVVEVGTGQHRDGFTVEFDRGYRESFRELDIRIGIVGLTACLKEAKAS